MRNVIMVAEKPMLAQSIAKILSNGQMNSRKGFNGACSVHEYTSTFLGQSAHYKVTSTCGHVMSLDFLGKYNNWDKVDPAELFQAQVEKKEANAKLKIPAFLAHEAKGCDCLVLWLDCDKEGENICFEVIDAVQQSMRFGPGQSIFRAKFSAITDKEIKHAMQNLGNPNQNEALAVDARQELDLRIGCAFTRFQTRYFQGKYGDLDSSLISFGPCQTPTLGFCVERHDEIMSFKPEPYWVVQVKLAFKPKGNTREDCPSQELLPDWAKGRVFDKDIAQLFFDRVKAQGTRATVLDVETKEGFKAKPQALNTVELMRVASAKLGMGPQHAMGIAEHLYTQGYISYPRTETNQYPDSFDLMGTLKQQLGNSAWSSVVQDVLQLGMAKPRKGVDVGDHPPITPMRADSQGSLSGDHARLYEYICRHFIASVSADCKYWLTTVKFDIGGELFILTGKTLISPGFTAAMPSQSLKEDETVPDLHKGDSVVVDDVKLTERQTNPPDYLTEAELITLMEKHGIGTDASIPVHINNITQRNYVTVGSGRRLTPTRLGIVLVHGYLKVWRPFFVLDLKSVISAVFKIDPELVLPTMRRDVETQLNLIARGKADFYAVKQHALEIFKQKFQYFVTLILSMDELFEVSFTSLSESGKPFTRCGKCRRYMKLVNTRPQRLHCSNCQDTYSLPQGRDGVIRLYGEHKCPLDDFELVHWFAGGRGKSFPLCPYCYNNPPFGDMKKLQGCNECTHPACPYAFSAWGVSQCTQCQLNGVFVLDAGSGPKWRISCNKCPATMQVFEGALKVKVLEDCCEQCNSQLVSVEYKEGKAAFPDNAKEYSGCTFCDPVLIPLVDLKGLTFNTQSDRGRGGFRPRGRGRGRGRGGRGRGSRGRGRGGRR